MTPSSNHKNLSPVWLLNAPVITADGFFRCETISTDTACELVRTRGFKSAIGHDITAGIISELLNIDCPVNRIEFAQEKGQQALVFRLNHRLDEGCVLENRHEVEKVGYTFMLISREA